ncbi:MAG: PadR family transcriptional regulator [Desulfosalsimonadaceae bacterium]
MIKYAILGLLHYRNMHGYRIKEHIERNFGHMWSINYGQIYPNLKKLQDDELILMAGVVQNDEKGPPRKLYAITEKGRREFTAWLDTSPEKSLLLRDPFLMRFVFYGFGDPGRAVEIIDEQIKRYEKDLTRRENNVDRWDKSGLYVRLIAELGVNLNAMMLDWLKHSKEEISKAEARELDNDAENPDIRRAVS